MKKPFSVSWLAVLWAGAVLSLCGALSPALARAQAAPKSESTASAAERRLDLAVESLRNSPLELRNLLLKMPKGADLHNHLYGALYAETWIGDAAADGMCLDPAAIHGVGPVYSQPEGGKPGNCAGGKIPAAQVFQDQHLYDQLVDAFSMRNFVPSAGVSGHDQFFNTFARFGGIAMDRHLGEWIDEVISRAARQNVQYIELMHTPDFGNAARAGYEIGWQDDLSRFREALLAKGLAPDIAAARKSLDDAEAERRKRERCDQPDASPACKLELRYLCQVLRGFPKQQVFAQTVLCFETVMADPRFVGINFVMPENGYLAMNDYALQMRMIAYLHSVYPKVHIALHAGEIAPGLVTYEGLCCHIRLAVEEAGAERIGHGVDVMYENQPHALLKEMAAKHVMVEINLTSNDVILGVAGKDHPLPVYRKFGVPVSLNTDDEGVSRIDFTHEYVKAVETFGLRYTDLKTMTRTGMEHTFLPGASLWASPDKFTAPASACARDALGTEKPSTACAEFLRSSEKARQQWELERRLREFESSAL